MINKKLFIGFILLPVILFCQTTKDSSRANKLFLFSAAYRCPVINSSIINSNHGLCFEGGVNAGYLFSKTSTIGFYGGWGWRDNLWNVAFNPGFVKDYKNAIITTDNNISPLDSAVISTSAELFATKKGSSLTMPGCETRSFHNYSLYYGLFIKLPINYPVIVKVYTGSTRSHYQGTGDLITTKKEYNILQLRRAMYGCELLLLNPVKVKQAVLKNIGVSVYYERTDFSAAILHFNDGQTTRQLALKRFTHSSLLKKYKSEQFFGFKISYTLI